jgi:eukaryotic-like serine/threonine-protein kinase
LAGWTVPGYTEIRVLGTGEAGRIAEAVHDPTGERVVITYPSAKLCSNPAFRARFRSDAELLEGLDHTNVVQVREIVETVAEVALITEAVEGAALRRVLAISGPLSPEAALAVLRASLLGLGAADEVGVAHRDYRPSNVVITPEGVCKVGGFGLAVRTEAMMPAAGSPSYMAPELWEGATPQLVTDMYAATATFYECLTGRVPYTSDSVFELQTVHRAAPIPVADVPAALVPLVTQGLAKAPAERPSSAAGFLAELEAAAVVEYGLEWEERGRRELAAIVAALPEEDPVAEAAASALPVVAASAGGEAASGGVAASGGGANAGDTDGSGDGSGMGRGAKAGIAAVAVAVIGAVVAAVALSPGKHSAAAAGLPGELVSTASDQSSGGDDGASPGIAGAAGPSGSSSAGSSPGSKSTTGGPTTSTTGTTSGSAPGTTGTPIGLPLPTVTSLSPPSSYPTGPATSGPSTSGGTGGPSSTSSVPVTVSATASMTQSTYNGPCPPGPTGSVTFSVSGLPSGSTVHIAYKWHVVGGSGGGGGAGSSAVDAPDGSTTQQFTVTDDGHSQKELSGTVEITWTAAGTPGGTTDAGSVDITCTPSGGGGATSGG